MGPSSKIWTWESRDTTHIFSYSLSGVNGNNSVSTVDFGGEMSPQQRPSRVFPLGCDAECCGWNYCLWPWTGLEFVFWLAWKFVSVIVPQHGPILLLDGFYFKVGGQLGAIKMLQIVFHCFVIIQFKLPSYLWTQREPLALCFFNMCRKQEADPVGLEGKCSSVWVLTVNTDGATENTDTLKWALEDFILLLKVKWNT